MRFEWRSRKPGDDALLAVSDGGDSVSQAWVADAPLIGDFLNDMEKLAADRKGANGLEAAQRVPGFWGPLVLARSDAGDILQVDPELYWDRMLFWFRAKGDDPHPWRSGK